MMGFKIFPLILMSRQITGKQQLSQKVGDSLTRIESDLRSAFLPAPSPVLHIRTTPVYFIIMGRGL